MHLWKSEKNTGTVSKVTSRKPFWQTGWSSQISSWTDLYYKDQMHGTNLSSNLALISRRALFFKPGSRKASLLMTDFSKLMSTEYLQRNKQTTNQKLKHFLDHIPQEKSSTHLVIVLLAAMKECRPKMDLIWRSSGQLAVSTSCDVQLLGFVWSRQTSPPLRRALLHVSGPEYWKLPK